MSPLNPPPPPWKLKPHLPPLFEITHKRGSPVKITLITRDNSKFKKQSKQFCVGEHIDFYRLNEIRKDPKQDIDEGDEVMIYIGDLTDSSEMEVENNMVKDCIDIEITVKDPTTIKLEPHYSILIPITVSNTFIRMVRGKISAP